MDFKLLPFLFFLSCSVTSVSAATAPVAADKLALLAIKSQITNDPFEVVSSWNETTEFCKWYGVSCSQRHRERVISLELSSQGLSGYLSPSIGNLTFLRKLVLLNNSFMGDIPARIGRLRRLQHLNLMYNSFQGGIPTNLSYCSDLRQLILDNNLLTGRVPDELSSLSKLESLSVYDNKLIGFIPPFLSNLSSLKFLALGGNQLEGSIPAEVGNLKNLEIFQVSTNMLIGDLPSSLFNLSHLVEFAVAFNQLQGKLPPSMGITLPSLKRVFFGVNRFEGPIPISLFNASGLESVDFSNNKLSGTVPSSLRKLENFYLLNLAVNYIHAINANDWRFIDDLTNCSRLKALSLYENMLMGVLPKSLANLSTSLQYLDLGTNFISGNIPIGIGNLVNVNVLHLDENLLVGNIPEDIGKIKMLEYLYLYNNSLTGGIPSSLSNLSKLNTLRLNDNNLEGAIFSRIRNLKGLFELDLSYNKFGGNIPKEFARHLYVIFYMDLSHNFLVGPVPLEVGSLKNIAALYLSGNQFSGEIPSTLSNCDVLQYLLLDNNFFEGEIPPSLGKIKGLAGLDLSHNNLSGPIPEVLEECYSLEFLNLSFNNLHGKVPAKGIFGNASAVSLHGNPGLCGGAFELRLPACPVDESRKEKEFGFVAILILIFAAMFILMVVFSILFVVLKLRNKKLADSVLDEEYPRVSYAQLVRATNEFSAANLIGAGKYGSVYKGSLDQVNGTVAVKVFKLQEKGGSRSFTNECTALRSIRHRNIFKILLVCSGFDSEGRDFKALVFEIMPNGSLEDWLHPMVYGDHLACCLSLLQRLNIAIDVANALDYLHNDCQMQIVHRDLKPSNILLDDDMVAQLGDFGSANVLDEATLQDSMSSVGIQGTIGYVAPEYGIGRHNSTAGDVYSYGILLLELFTGKRPVNAPFKDGLTLHDFAARAFPKRVMDIIDPGLLDSPQSIEARRTEECLILIIRTGLSCSKHSPEERMKMRDVVHELCAIRNAYNGS